MKKLLRAGQVAARLGVSAARIGQLRQSGDLIGIETPLGFLYAEEEVDSLERKRTARRSSAKPWRWR